MNPATVSEAEHGFDFVFDDYPEEYSFEDFDQTSEELLYSINSNLTQINVTLSFLVTVGFALIIVYIIIRPVFYFFK